MKKFSLSKSALSAFRLFGKDSLFTLDDSFDARVLELYFEIHRMNTLQIIGEKIYFSIDSNETLNGPFVEVIGISKVNDSGFCFKDLRNVTQFSGILWTSAQNEAINRESFAEVFIFYREIVKKLPICNAFLAIEMNKIELHFFVQ